MARFCAEVLATGARCTQFARKDQPWCRAHSHPRLRERNLDTRQFISWIAYQDLAGIANGIGKVACELRLKLITPLHAEAVLDAALARLDQLTEEQGGAKSGGTAADNFKHDNRLQSMQME